MEKNWKKKDVDVMKCWCFTKLEEKNWKEWSVAYTSKLMVFGKHWFSTENSLWPDPEETTYLLTYLQLLLVVTSLAADGGLVSGLFVDVRDSPALGAAELTACDVVERK